MSCSPIQFFWKKMQLGFLRKIIFETLTLEEKWGIFLGGVYFMWMTERYSCRWMDVWMERAKKITKKQIQFERKWEEWKKRRETKKWTKCFGKNYKIPADNKSFRDLTEIIYLVFNEKEPLLHD